MTTRDETLEMGLGDAPAYNSSAYMIGDKALRKLEELRKAKETLEGWLGAEVARLDTDIAFWESQLRMATAELNEVTGKASAVFPSGHSMLKATKGRFKITDEARAREWINQTIAPDVVGRILKTRTETAIQASELRDALEASYTLTPEGKFVDKDGAAIVFAEVEGIGLSLSYGSGK